MATLWVMIGAITAAIIARGVKISEFRQAWINELRPDITEYVTKAHEWIELYEYFNAEDSQEKKAELAPQLHRFKYDALHYPNRIESNFASNLMTLTAIDYLKSLGICSILETLPRLIDTGVGVRWPNRQYSILALC